MEGVIDGLAVSLRAPKAFDLLLNKVWPKLDKEPRLEKDFGAPVIQRSLEKVLSAVHAQTGRTEGMWHKEWQSWWSTVDEADREEALAHPLGQRLPAEMADGQVVLDAGDPSDGYKPGGETYVPGTTPAGEPESVVFVFHHYFWMGMKGGPQACADMIRALPNGTRFNVISGAVFFSDRDETKLFVCWKPELTPANPTSVQEAVEWTLRWKGDNSYDGDFASDSEYYYLAAAVSLHPDRVILFGQTLCLSAYRNRRGHFPDSHDEECRRGLFRTDLTGQREAHQNQLYRWNRRLIDAALNPLIFAGPDRNGLRPTAMCSEIFLLRKAENDIPAAERWARMTGGYVNIWPRGSD